VHNLVQHNHLVRSGVSFEMSRDVSGKSVDFLASRDRWTRPVMTRTGPDGALWVVDMYRYVIEHPHWLPKEAQAVVAPYLRAGDGRGRIYRVVPQEQPPRSIPKLARLTTAELVSRLDDPSGWVRDAAKQLLLEKPPADVRAALLPMLTTAATPQGKLNAWYALQMIEPCDQSLLIQGLTDPENEIRRHTLRFAEAIEQPGAALIDAVKRLSTDADPAVRLQLALSLGAWKQPFASALIGEMLTQEDSSPFIRSALLSSLNESNIAEVAIAVARMPMRDAGFRDVYRKVARQSLDYRQHQPLIEACVIEDPTDQELARAIVVGGVARQFWGPTLKGIPTELEASLDAVVRHARAVLATETSPQWLRTLTIDALFLLPDSLSTDLDTARSLLQPTVPFELQLALIQHLGKQSEPECCGLMLQGWSGYSPKTRDSILEAVLSQPTWHSQLVKALDERDVKVSDVSLSLRQRFLSQPDSKALHKHFRQVAPDNQRRPLDTQRVQMSKGDAERGNVVFLKNCSSCHRLDDEGKHIGPNLESLTNPTVASLLEAILEPNNAVEAKYQTYLVVTADGRIISGMITSESNNSLTILRPDGESSAVRRSDIDEIQATGKSLMPEGFDRVISSGEMADLLTYLQKQQQQAAQP
ncbi:MAG: HEAT repeat domain-containing protein, partial [Pirellulaceae bacterium]